MTQMQSPYEEQSDVKLYQEPDRTSIMAIFSLIFAIGGCCTLGITSIPAILLGVFGLFGISRSKGRVGGTGIGIAGILIGIISLALWIGLLLGGGGMIKTFLNQLGGTVETALLEVQADNFDAARLELTGPLSNTTDAELVAFRESYRSTLGDLVSKPDGLGDWWAGYAAVFEQFEPYSGQQGYMPMPMHFDSGWALVIYVMDTQSTNGNMPGLLAIIIVDSQGNEYTLPIGSGSGSSQGGDVPDGELPAADMPAPGDEPGQVEPELEPDVDPEP